ncbi:MAG: alkaline phosphatase family protein [Gammaproteobacteria bacterium]|nr:alkaline phosphatase family protein [Gammaproteobacteria bacterium]
MILPDYHGGSLANLMASLRAALGEPSPVYPPLRDLPPEEVAGARNVVLLVADGLGDRMLRELGQGSVLERHRRGSMTSVFPSTTASAITTFMTGEAPQQHGLTGWFTYLAEAGSVLAVLPFRARFGGASLSAAGIEPRALFGFTPLFDTLAVPSVVVAPEWIMGTDFNNAASGSARRLGYKSLAQLFASVASVVEAPGQKYVYAYLPDIDSLAHEHGVMSAKVAARFAEFDAAFGAFLERIRGTDTLVIATADHGLIDTAPDKLVHLNDHPDLAETLVLPLCGEPRAAYCYVHPDQASRFESYVADKLAHCAELHRSEELLARGFFGLGEPHPRLRQRIGHYTLLMKDNWVIKDQVAGEKPFRHIGVHGGVSGEEMEVPLVVVRV